MSTQQIDKERWTEYLDHLSNVTDSHLVTIELIGLSVGDQIEIEDVEFKGITYDGDDVISVQAGDLDHLINKPVELYVLEEDDGLKSIEITDAKDNKHLLHFKRA